MKDILKKLPYSGINKYIEMWKGNVLEKQQWRNSTKMEKDKMVLETFPPVLNLQNPVFRIWVFTNN